MNKQELIEALAKEAAISKKQAKDIIDAFIISIKDSLARGKKISISGFGTFSLLQRRGYIGKNPRTGEKINVAAMMLPHFKSSKIFKESIK